MLIRRSRSSEREEKIIPDGEVAGYNILKISKE